MELRRVMPLRRWTSYSPSPYSPRSRSRNYSASVGGSASAAEGRYGRATAPELASETTASEGGSATPRNRQRRATARPAGSVESRRAWVEPEIAMNSCRAEAGRELAAGPIARGRKPAPATTSPWNPQSSEPQTSVGEPSKISLRNHGEPRRAADARTGSADVERRARESSRRSKSSAPWNPPVAARPTLELPPAAGVRLAAKAATA